MMTGGAGERIVFRKPGIVKELPAESNRILGRRVVGWYRYRRQAERSSDFDSRSNGFSRGDRRLATEQGEKSDHDKRQGRVERSAFYGVSTWRAKRKCPRLLSF